MNSRVLLVGVMMLGTLAGRPLSIAVPQISYPPAQVADLVGGTVQLPEGWTQKRTGTKDSFAGQIASGKGLIVNYDIGGNAGTRMSDQRISACKCIWYKERTLHGHLARIGLVETKAGRELAVTLFDTVQRLGMKYPANFWATVQGDEDVADTLLIALSYEAAP